MADIAYDSTYAYEGLLTYWGAIPGEEPVLKVEIDLTSTYFINVEDTEFAGSIAYDTINAYNVALQYSGAVPWTDVTSATRDVTISRGKSNRLYDYFDAGTASLQLNDYNSQFLPGNTATYAEVQTMRPIRISAYWSGTYHRLFRGYIDHWDIVWRQGEQFANVRITATDGSKILTKLQTTYQGSPGDSASTRIGGLLTDSGWPTTFRDIDATSTTVLVQDSSTSQGLIERIQDVQFAEAGAFFFGGDGKATFKNRTNSYPTGATFAVSDSGATTVVPYIQVDGTIDDGQLYNKITLTEVSGTPQTVENAVSQQTFGTRELEKDDILVNSSAQTLALANFLLARYKTPGFRIESFTIDPKVSIFASQMVVLAELLSTATVTRSAPSYSFSLNVFVIGIEHRITPEDWNTTYILDRQ